MNTKAGMAMALAVAGTALCACAQEVRVATHYETVYATVGQPLLNPDTGAEFVDNDFCDIDNYAGEEMTEAATITISGFPRWLVWDSYEFARTGFWDKSKRVRRQPGETTWWYDGGNYYMFHGTPTDAGEWTLRITASWKDGVSQTVSIKLVVRGPAGASGYKKAQTLTGAIWTGDGVAALTIKTGKAGKKGVVSVSGSILQMNGKKLAVKSAKLPVGGDGTLNGSLSAKDGSTINITVDADKMRGDWKGLPFASGEDRIGGSLEGGRTYRFSFAGPGELPEGTLLSLLPLDEPIAVSNGKWALGKASTVKLAKDRGTGVSGLVVDDRGGTATNKSGLKLSYAPRTGLFKGSFKVYALQNDKLRKYTAKVTGIVANGTGYGISTIKGLGGISIEID